MTYFAAAWLLMSGSTIGLDYVILRIGLSGGLGERVRRGYLEIVIRLGGLRNVMILLSLFAIPCWPVGLVFCARACIRDRRTYLTERLGADPLP
jgi:hypothetical protein